MPRKGKFGTVDITVLGDELKVGDKAPDFKADKMDLTEYHGRKRGLGLRFGF